VILWLNLAYWGHIILWAGLLIHCLLKRRFFPLLGSGLGTKAFWLVTFVLVNPLLTLLYLIFGVILRAKEDKPRTQLAGKIICLVLVVLVIAVFELPRPGRSRSDVITRHAGLEKEEGIGFQAQAGVLEASNSHSSTFKGIESSEAQYEQQAENIGKQLVEAISKQLDQWVEEHGLLPELPDYMYGGELPELTFTFLEHRKAKLLYHGGGLLENYLAVWHYEDSRPNIDVFKEVRDTLQAQGWKGGSALDKASNHKLESFTLHKAKDHMQILRKRECQGRGGVIYGDDEGLEKKLPIIVEYRSLFTQAQTDDALTRLFASEADLDAKLIFESCSSDESIKQLLFDAVESQQVKTMDGYLLIGRYYAGRDETAKATEALMIARALGHAQMKHNPAAQEIKSLAKQIGDESLAKLELGIEHYQRAGFTDMSTVDMDSVYERGVDEPLLFYVLPADEAGREKPHIKTVAIRISKAIDTKDHYDVETVTRQRGSSSVSKGDLYGSLDLHDPMGHETLSRLVIEKLEGDRFKLSVQNE
jgi:hypothetical protein